MEARGGHAPSACLRRVGHAARSPTRRLHIERTLGPGAMYALPRKSRGHAHDADASQLSSSPQNVERARALEDVLVASEEPRARPERVVQSSTPHRAAPAAFARGPLATPRDASHAHNYPTLDLSASRSLSQTRSVAPMSILEDEAPAASFARDFVEAPLARSGRAPFVPRRAPRRAPTPDDVQLTRRAPSPASSSDDPLLLNDPSFSHMSIHAAQGDTNLVEIVRRFEAEDLDRAPPRRESLPGQATPRRRLSAGRHDLQSPASYRAFPVPQGTPRRRLSANRQELSARIRSDASRDASHSTLRALSRTSTVRAGESGVGDASMYGRTGDASTPRMRPTQRRSAQSKDSLSIPQRIAQLTSPQKPGASHTAPLLAEDQAWDAADLPDLFPADPASEPESDPARERRPVSTGEPEPVPAPAAQPPTEAKHQEPLAETLQGEASRAVEAESGNRESEMRDASVPSGEVHDTRHPVEAPHDATPDAARSANVAASTSMPALPSQPVAMKESPTTPRSISMVPPVEPRFLPDTRSPRADNSVSSRTSARRSGVRPVFTDFRDMEKRSMADAASDDTSWFKPVSPQREVVRSTPRPATPSLTATESLAAASPRRMSPSAMASTRKQLRVGAAPTSGCSETPRRSATPTPPPSHPPAADVDDEFANAFAETDAALEQTLEAVDAIEEQFRQASEPDDRSVAADIGAGVELGRADRFEHGAGAAESSADALHDDFGLDVDTGDTASAVVEAPETELPTPPTTHMLVDELPAAPVTRMLDSPPEPRSDMAAGHVSMTDELAGMASLASEERPVDPAWMHEDVSRLTLELGETTSLDAFDLSAAADAFRGQARLPSRSPSRVQRRSEPPVHGVLFAAKSGVREDDSTMEEAELRSVSGLAPGPDRVDADEEAGSDGDVESGVCGAEAVDETDMNKAEAVDKAVDQAGVNETDTMNETHTDGEREAEADTEIRGRGSQAAAEAAAVAARHGVRPGTGLSSTRAAPHRAARASGLPVPERATRAKPLYPPLPRASATSRHAATSEATHHTTSVPSALPATALRPRSTPQASPFVHAQRPAESSSVRPPHSAAPPAASASPAKSALRQSTEARTPEPSAEAPAAPAPLVAPDTTTHELTVWALPLQAPISLDDVPTPAPDTSAPLDDLSASLSAASHSRAMMLARPRPTSCIEVSSLDPVAAARAAAILKVHHRYVAEGWLSGALEAPEATENAPTLPALLTAAEHALRGDVPGDTTQTPHVPGAFALPPAPAPTTPLVRTHAAHGQWTAQAWSMLERELLAHIARHASDGDLGTLRAAALRVDVDEVVARFLESEGLGPDDLCGEWTLTRLYARVPALQARFLRRLDAHDGATQQLLEKSFHLYAEAPRRDVSFGSPFAMGTHSTPLPAPAGAAPPPADASVSLATSVGADTTDGLLEEGQKRARDDESVVSRLWTWVRGRSSKQPAVDQDAEPPAKRARHASSTDGLSTWTNDARSSRPVKHTLTPSRRRAHRQAPRMSRIPRPAAPAVSAPQPPAPAGGGGVRGGTSSVASTVFSVLGDDAQRAAARRGAHLTERRAAAWESPRRARLRSLDATAWPSESDISNESRRFAAAQAYWLEREAADLAAEALDARRA